MTITKEQLTEWYNAANKTPNGKLPPITTDKIFAAMLYAYEAGRKSAVSEPVLTGCACRWDANDKRVATCVRHQGWLDVVSEWADRAKEAEAKLRTPPAEAKREPITDEQIQTLTNELLSVIDGVHHDDVLWDVWANQFARAIEKAHNIGAKE